METTNVRKDDKITVYTPYPAQATVLEDRREVEPERDILDILMDSLTGPTQTSCMMLRDGRWVLTSLYEKLFS